MKRTLHTLLSMACLLLLATAGHAQEKVKYKCLVQMNGYQGQGAYIVISLVDKDDKYQQTLYMLGPDKKWYPDLKEWHTVYKKKPADISAVTGASVTGGDRAMVTLELDKARINAGYKLRFESAVEDKPYHVKDAEVPLTTEGLAAKTEGKGYIKYVRFSGN